MIVQSRLDGVLNALFDIQNCGVLRAARNSLDLGTTIIADCAAVSPAPYAHRISSRQLSLRSVLLATNEFKGAIMGRLLNHDEWFSEEGCTQEGKVPTIKSTPNQARIERMTIPEATEAVISRTTSDDTVRSLRRQVTVEAVSTTRTKVQSTEKGGFRRNLRRLFGLNASKGKSLNKVTKKQDTQANISMPSPPPAPIGPEVEQVQAAQQYPVSIECGAVKLQRRDTFESLFAFDGPDSSSGAGNETFFSWDKVSRSTDQLEVLNERRPSFDEPIALGITKKENFQTVAGLYRPLSSRSDPIDQLLQGMDISFDESKMSTEFHGSSIEPKAHSEDLHGHITTTPKNTDEDTQRLTDKVSALEKELALLKQMIQFDLRQSSMKSETTSSRSEHSENEDFISTGIRSTSYDALFEVEDTQRSTRVETPTIMTTSRSISSAICEELSAQNPMKLEEPTTQTSSRSSSSSSMTIFQEENKQIPTKVEETTHQTNSSCIGVMLFEEERWESSYQDDIAEHLHYSVENSNSDSHLEEEIDWNRIREARQPLESKSSNAGAAQILVAASLDEPIELATQVKLPVFSEGFDPLDHLDSDVLLQVQRPAKPPMAFKESEEVPDVIVGRSSSPSRESFPEEIKTIVEDSDQSIDRLDGSLQKEYDEAWNRMRQEAKERKKKSQQKQYRLKQSTLHASSRSTRRRHIACSRDDSTFDPLILLPPASTKPELRRKSKGNRNTSGSKQSER
uniref:AlNc14C108G6304 protein n=1 Tax=Albugo laibachii Nc14 TaxID=890382 RepID=F0WI98_9STRA|nr:AlNc14C108G6304 [Albugo laibachii Nc14]|eukprot:CCA20977.1 AlNc14C108G6304 [Albugo laibachii Nc14]